MKNFGAVDFPVLIPLVCIERNTCANAVAKCFVIVVGYCCKAQTPSHIIMLIPILELRGLKMTHVTGTEFVVSVVILPHPDKADWAFRKSTLP